MNKPKPNKPAAGKSLYDLYLSQEMPSQIRKRQEEKKKSEAEAQRVRKLKEQERLKVEAAEARERVKREEKEFRATPVNFGVTITKRAPYPHADPYLNARQITMVLVGFTERSIRLTSDSAAWAIKAGVNRIRLRVVDRHGGVLMRDVTPCQLPDVVKAWGEAA